MKNNTLLVVLLVCSVCLNVYLWLIQGGNMTQCVITPGFEAPSTINNDEAAGFARQFQESHSGSGGIQGGVITRSGFDQILCTANCNAITYTFAIDSTGTTGPANSGVFVIFSGVNVEYDEQTQRVIRVNELNIDNYITKLWCPPTCNNN